MSFVLPQIVVQRVIQIGLRHLQSNPDILDEIFAMYTCDMMQSDYGEAYIEKIKSWFLSTKIRVVQSWSYNPQQMPLISINLSSEQEDERNASIGDYFEADEEGQSGVGAISTTLDIGIHATKTGDEVLWLYYIATYILYVFKKLFEMQGIHLHSFSASDYNRDASKLGDNIWTRWIKFRAVTFNTWNTATAISFDEIDFNIDFDRRLDYGSEEN